MTPSIADVRRAHFVGMGGAGMSAIAKVMIEMGISVAGSDLKRSPAVALLEAMGARFHLGHSAGLISEDLDLVVVSSAIPDSNPEVVAAGTVGITIASRGEVLAALLSGHPSIVVAGTHGKTTTTSMAIAILRAAGIDPTYLVGGGLNDSNKTNARLGRDDLHVAESDESDGSFLLLDPQIAVVTNVEADHLDRWGSLENIVEAFDRFMGRVHPEGAIVVPRGDELLMELARRHGRDLITFGADGDVQAHGIQPVGTGSRFSLRARGSAHDVELRVPGAHNVSNALAAAAACLAWGVEPEEIAHGLGSFAGVERRFQLKGERGGVAVVDDYAHHPTEIRAALTAASQGPWRRVVAVFQPHLYSRTAAFEREFGGSFAEADRVVITDIYAAREQPVPGVTGKLVSDAVARSAPGRPVAYLPHRDELVSYLLSTARPGDVLMLLGAGDIPAVGDELLARLAGRAA